MRRQRGQQAQLARRISWEQQRRSMTNADLALALRDRGCLLDATALSKVKSGRRTVTLDEAVALAGIFETTLDGLLKDVEWALNAELNAALQELHDRRREVVDLTAKTTETVRRALALTLESGAFEPRLLEASAVQQNAMVNLIDLLLEVEARVRGDDPATYPDSSDLLFKD